MKQRQYEDFVGFRFGSIHSSELGLKVVSSSKRYDKNLMPSPEDVTLDIPGGDGQYYFGSTFKNQEIQVDVAFDDIDEPTWRKMSQIFSTDKPQDLVFDELPFKTYKAKLKAKPNFKFICFYDKEREQRVYKGEGQLSFICYYPYAFCFNKYVVRAADNYYTPHPARLLGDVNESPYGKKKLPKQRTYLETEHYNTEGNMYTPWQGGFPTLEQVQNGELYFNDPNGDSKLLVDTRAYWNNVPEWQSAAQLLVSPTLDPDGDLIFLPQYSKVNYYNMDTGLNMQNGIIGSRLLVYNPGDLPVDFELRLGNLSSSLRRKLDSYSFRISRYNVQRLTIEQAVDWTGLTTYNADDNEPYKYGDKYFKIIETNPANKGKDSCCLTDPENWVFEPYIRDLGCAHPKHTYIIEPVPREKLGYFIKLFYWQNEGCKHTDVYEEGVEMANRYDELYNLCITDEERFELYWNTLGDLLGDSLIDYIYNPPEYLLKNDLSYGEFDFNSDDYTDQYYTFDYFDINNDNFQDIYGGEVNRKILPLDDPRRQYVLPLYLNTEKRMLYNINESSNPYDLKLTKTIHNENIEKGHWFKIPPGWSLIDISPILDGKKWDGKRWLDARPFEWGNPNERYRVWYDKVYKAAAVEYLANNITTEGISVGNGLLREAGKPYEKQAHFQDYTYAEMKPYFKDLELEELECFMQFNRWYYYGPLDIYNNKGNNKQKRKSAEKAELGFLNLLAVYWRVNRICNGKPIGDINDWWWYANNYIWGNFPPIYWGYADLLNHAQIKYVPLFY